MNKCVFTICAKNYLAQALTLKESFQRYNDEIDFYIFLADLCDDQLRKEIQNLIILDCAIIPKWKEMAFKYDVIEFSTSIKPFCINYLFDKYEKIIYLDPDIYVTASLNIVFNWLNDKDMVITPHYNHIAIEYSGAVSENALSFVGIYNLGFMAIKNSEKGIEIIKWWMKRLEDNCYIDRNTAQHVDQRWIDFLPAFFTDDILISHHQGCNVAIWNIHERELILKNGTYLVRDLVKNDIKELLFFHFSGFDPFNKKIFNRRHPEYNIEVYPSFIPIIEEYVNKIYSNNYDVFSKQKYAFDYFTNDIKILPINRRIYRTLLHNHIAIEDLFSDTGTLYKQFKKKNLISHEKNSIKKNEKYQSDQIYRKKKIKTLNLFLRLIFYILGIDKYSLFLRALRSISWYENQYFLYEDTNEKIK
jgi:hypothetical protein